MTTVVKDKPTTTDQIHAKLQEWAQPEIDRVKKEAQERAKARIQVENTTRQNAIDKLRDALHAIGIDADPIKLVPDNVRAHHFYAVWGTDDGLEFRLRFSTADAGRVEKSIDVFRRFHPDIQLSDEERKEVRGFKTTTIGLETFKNASENVFSAMALLRCFREVDQNYRELIDNTRTRLERQAQEAEEAEQRQKEYEAEQAEREEQRKAEEAELKAEQEEFAAMPPVCAVAVESQVSQFLKMGYKLLTAFEATFISEDGERYYKSVKYILVKPAYIAGGYPWQQ